MLVLHRRLYSRKVPQGQFKAATAETNRSTQPQKYSRGAIKRTARGSPLVRQKGGKGAMPLPRNGNRAALDDEQTRTLLRHFQGKDHAATNSFTNGANLEPLPDSHAKDLQLFIEQHCEKHATVTTLEARGEFYKQNYPDPRLEHTQCSQGYPLETPCGTRTEKNETVYTLLQNCTVASPKEVDKNGIPNGKYGQVMTAPLRSYGPLVVEYTGL
ncbi:hypothetical protein CYMTET_56887 [Cymbomonas tetramitiformis]|uniref:Uncharacterized protein n=1 Tax=Cymbomonas tetramitiformis TaxID=36881 RepID=A0AAE0ENB4_9CHLO|nr:hypothetical protein CYMTET_56887 [Cymbomonas tetramitiformis]